MNRRRFLLGSASAAAGVWVGLETVGSRTFSPVFATPAPLTQKVAASDVVILGKTGIRAGWLVRAAVAKLVLTQIGRATP